MLFVGYKAEGTIKKKEPVLKPALKNIWPLAIIRNKLWTKP